MDTRLLFFSFKTKKREYFSRHCSEMYTPVSVIVAHQPAAYDRPTKEGQDYIIIMVLIHIHINTTMLQCKTGLSPSVILCY